MLEHFSVHFVKNSQYQKLFETDLLLVTTISCKLLSAALTSIIIFLKKEIRGLEL